MLVVSVEQMKAIEKEADENGINYGEMIERAGRGVAELMLLSTVMKIGRL